MAANFRLLIINPNTTKSMTDGLKPLVDSLGYKDTTYTYFTAPSGPSSINNNDDVASSARHCLPALEPLVGAHDGFLVACYSEHPLVPALHDLCAGARKPAVGIFEASVTAGLHLASLVRHERFGIVSTGKVWEGLLTEAVGRMLGSSSSASEEEEEGGTSSAKGNPLFAGVETTGLNATELHDAPQEEVRRKIKEAARRLMGRGNVTVIILGCAGMAGMDEWVREEVGEGVRVVDGVKAGVGVLQGLVRARF